MAPIFFARAMFWGLISVMARLVAPKDLAAARVIKPVWETQSLKTYQNDTNMASARPMNSVLMAEVCMPLGLHGRLANEYEDCRSSILMG